MEASPGKGWFRHKAVHWAFWSAAVTVQGFSATCIFIGTLPGHDTYHPLLKHFNGTESFVFVNSGSLKNGGESKRWKKVEKSRIFREIFGHLMYHFSGVFFWIFFVFLRLRLYHKTHHTPYFSRLFNDFIIYPNDQFFIEKNIIQKSIHVFKKHPNRLGYGLCCYFHFKTSGNLEFDYSRFSK